MDGVHAGQHSGELLGRVRGLLGVIHKATAPSSAKLQALSSELTAIEVQLVNAPVSVPAVASSEQGNSGAVAEEEDGAGLAAAAAPEVARPVDAAKTAAGPSDGGACNRGAGCCGGGSCGAAKHENQPLPDMGALKVNEPPLVVQ